MPLSKDGKAQQDASQETCLNYLHTIFGKKDDRATATYSYSISIYLWHRQGAEGFRGHFRGSSRRRFFKKLF